MEENKKNLALGIVLFIISIVILFFNHFSINGIIGLFGFFLFFTGLIMWIFSKNMLYAGIASIILIGFLIIVPPLLVHLYLSGGTDSQTSLQPTPTIALRFDIQPVITLQPTPKDVSSYILQATPHQIVGHKYEVRGQYYDYDPAVPLINQGDKNVASIGAAFKINDFNNYDDLYNQYNYHCFSLKNEGTQAATIAQSAAAGSASREQVLNYYSITLDAIQREKNCQRSISVFQPVLVPTLYDTNVDQKRQMRNELETNDGISKNDENIMMTNYNRIASNFNNAISSCSNSDQVIGNDGMCHDICVAPNIYCE